MRDDGAIKLLLYVHKDASSSVLVVYYYGLYCVVVVGISLSEACINMKFMNLKCKHYHVLVNGCRETIPSLSIFV